MFLSFLSSIWFFLIRLVRIALKGEKNRKIMTLKNLFIACLNILVSAPVTYIFTVEDPFTGKKHIEDRKERNIFRMVYLYFIVINICIILLGVFS
jgi:dolichyl-phosphate-mannose--protein O-mannosyl transferase